MRSTEGRNLRRDPLRLWGEKTLSWLPVGLGGGDVPRFKTTPEGWGGGEVEQYDYVEDEEDKDQHHDDYVFDGDDSDVYPSSWALPVTAIIKSPSVATIFDGSWITWLVKIALGVFDCIHQCKTVQDSLVILSMIWLGDIWLPSWYTHLMQGHFCTRLYLYLYPVLRPRVLDRVHIGVHITEVWIIPSWVMRIRFLLKV